MLASQHHDDKTWWNQIPDKRLKICSKNFWKFHFAIGWQWPTPSQELSLWAHHTTLPFQCGKDGRNPAPVWGVPQVVSSSSTTFGIIQLLPSPQKKGFAYELFETQENQDRKWIRSPFTTLWILRVLGFWTAPHSVGKIHHLWRPIPSLPPYHRVVTFWNPGKWITVILTEANSRRCF